MRITANYYDGVSAHRYPVTLELQNGNLQLSSEEIQRELKPQQYRISARLGNSPRLIGFTDGAHCEIVDNIAFEEHLKQTQYRPSFVAQLELHWHYLGAITLVTAAVLITSYFFGLPLLAEKIASQVPTDMLVLLDEQVLKTMDESLMQPSKLTPSRQQAIFKRLSQLNLPPKAVKLRQLLFRASPKIGANAFTLPGGTILVLDELVALSKNDEEIIAVLAHELGHLAEHHAVRQIVQASAIGLVVGWFVGDFSSLLAIAPATLLETRYSRDFERRADSFAADVLKRNAIAPQRLSDILKRLEAAHPNTTTDKTQRLLDFFSTHPATEERERALKAD